MNCDAARRLLLGEENPDRPSDDDVRRHLGGCSACRVLGRRIARIEGQIPRLPVPASSAKEAFVRRFVRTGGPVVRRVPAPWPTPAKERGLRKLSLAVAIAAVLAFFTLGLWSWPHLAQEPPAQAPSWVAEIQKERERIARLPAPRDRVKQTGDLASALRDRARVLTLAGDADGLAGLVKVYGDVVVGDLPRYARDVPAPERAGVLAAVTAELREAESEFSRTAAAERSAPTARPLRELARAARDGGRRIQDLLKTA